MKYIVYLTKNLKSKVGELNKIYIGVHQTENPDIFDGYLGCGVYINQPSTFMYPKTPFQYAVKKYGTKAFERTILYIFNTPEEAYEKELELVNDTFLNSDHTYNYCSSVNNISPLYQFNTTGELEKKWNYSLEAYDFYGESPKKFQFAISNKSKFLNSYWSLEPEIDVIKYSLNKLNNTIYLYTRKGKLLNEFLDKDEYIKYLGDLDINKAIKNQSLVLDMYYISNKLIDEFIPKTRANYKNLIYHVYNKDGVYIGQFKGKMVMKVINLHSWNKIKNVILYNNGWYKDYYISTTEVINIPDKYYSKGIMIDIYDTFGNYIETLDNIKDVREKYNIPSSKLKNIQMGDKYYKDYIFKYHK